MKRIKNVKNTIVFKLILSIILIFIVMTATSNYIIGKYQEKRIQDIGEKIVMEETNKGNKDYFIVLEDSKLKSTKEIKNFSLIVIGSTIALGSLVYYFLVSRSLKPLKELKERVQEIDIDKVNSEEKFTWRVSRKKSRNFPWPFKSPWTRSMGPTQGRRLCHLPLHMS